MRYTRAHSNRRLPYQDQRAIRPSLHLHRVRVRRLHTLLDDHQQVSMLAVPELQRAFKHELYMLQ